MLKGDLVKREDVWHVIYSSENSGRINEIPVTDYSAKSISEKRGDKIKFFSGVSFEIIDGKAAVKLVPDYPPKKIVKEGEKPSFVSPKLDKPFSKEEEEIMNLIIEARSKFYQLQQNYPSDITDLEFHLNGVQRIMAQRVFRRNYPNIL
jgi:hypothetical protein